MILLSRSLVNYFNLMTLDFYGKEKRMQCEDDYRICVVSLGPWDEKTGIFAPLFHQHYQTDTESLRNVVSRR